MYIIQHTDKEGQTWTLASRVPVDPEINPEDIVAQILPHDGGMTAMNFWATVAIELNSQTTDVIRAAELVEQMTLLGGDHLA